MHGITPTEIRAILQKLIASNPLLQRDYASLAVNLVRS